ncbi:MAG: RluA family pseudouridine synthase [Lachnospiraceae bacterium]|nr:RluA family pseudouridine synthase [Lachnospiraceae bacterium]
MKDFEFIISDEDSSSRIDKVIADNYEEFSRSYIQKLISDKLVFVNRKNVKGSYTVKEGDKVTFTTPDAIIPDIIPENIPLDVLYEDSDVIVINKPKDMVVHPAAGHYSGTLVNGLMYYLKKGDTYDLSGINGVLRPGIVHRIDKDTTGSLIICKNDSAHEKLATQLKEHSINRIYVAIVHGVLKDDEGVINMPIGRSDKDRKKMAVNAKISKPAVTHYKVLKRFDKYTFVELKLETGRTHQIRVHMSAINHPVLGDEVYCTLKCPFKLKGQTLHAKTLGFIQPTTGEYVEVNAPLPEYFEKLLNII